MTAHPGLLAFVVFALTGCVSSVTGSTYHDGRFWYSNVKSASDAAGGPRQDLMVVVDRDGRVETFTSSGIGTFQATAASLGPALVSAAGQAAGSALIRPARNTTNVEMNVEGGAAGGGTSNTSATGGGGTTSSVSGTTATAAGGAGGTGGAGGAGGSPGNTGGGNIPPGQINQLTQ